MEPSASASQGTSSPAERVPGAPEDQAPAPHDQPAAPDDQPAAPDDQAEKLTMSRRTLLASSAAATAAAYVASFSSTPVARYLEGVPVRLVDEVPSPQSTGAGSGIIFHVERDSDLLLLDFAFHGFKLDKLSDPISLVPTTTRNWVIVQFPPQAIGEGVYNERVYPPPKASLDSPPVLSVLSGPSQLAFSIRKGVTVPFSTMTVNDLLDWSEWTLLVPPVAVLNNRVNGKPPLPSFPPSNSTLIECPYGLYLSPVVNPGVIEPRVVEPHIAATTSWRTSFAGTVQPPVSAEGVSECWTAKLTYEQVLSIKGKVARATPLEPQVSAVWCRDLELYANYSGTGVSNWVPWTKTNSKKQVIRVLDNDKYFATPNTSRIPVDE